MTEKQHPEKGLLDLHRVLHGLGHTPESFARFIDRNASGIRRIIYGKHEVSRHMAKDIVEGLYALGFRDDPGRIWQLRKIPPGVLQAAFREQAVLARQTNASETPALGTRVTQALANLMLALGREEVDRVYRRVFGARPDDKNE